MKKENLSVQGIFSEQQNLHTGGPLASVIPVVSDII